MAERKNQHFVPRVHFAPWTLNRDGKAINVFNLTLGKGIRNAPLKGQCSRDYFYGEDLQIEKWLGVGEGIYARLVREISDPTLNDKSKHLNLFLKFAFLQHLRTEQSIGEDARLMQKLYDHVFLNDLATKEPRPTHKESVKSAFIKWRDTQHTLYDLKAVLIRNTSGVPFITSDDPCIHTNKLHLVRFQKDTFGLGSAGCIITMPLSPDYAVMYYDGDIYSIPSKVGDLVTLSKKSDVIALNGFQLVRCGNNVYFDEWAMLQDIQQQFEAVADRRISMQHRFHVLVPAEGRPNTFRRATEDELAKPGTSMIHTENVSFNPSSWPQFLQYRVGRHGYSNGSGAGFVRWSQAKANGMTAQDKVRF